MSQETVSAFFLPFRLHFVFSLTVPKSSFLGLDLFFFGLFFFLPFFFFLRFGLTSRIFGFLPLSLNSGFSGFVFTGNLHSNVSQRPNRNRWRKSDSFSNSKSSGNKSRLFCHWYHSPSTPKWAFYKCIFSNYLKWTLFVHLLDSVAWFVPEICHFEIDWSEFHVSKHGKNGHPPSSRWRCKLS